MTLAERIAALIDENALVAAHDGAVDAELPGLPAAVYTHAIAAPDGKGVTLSPRKVCVTIVNAPALGEMIAVVAEEWARSVSGPFDA